MKPQSIVASKRSFEGLEVRFSCRTFDISCLYETTDVGGNSEPTRKS
jgi:hypothetical protein